MSATAAILALVVATSTTAAAPEPCPPGRTERECRQHVELVRRAAELEVRWTAIGELQAKLDRRDRDLAARDLEVEQLRIDLADERKRRIRAEERFDWLTCAACCGACGAGGAAVGAGATIGACR